MGIEYEYESLECDIEKIVQQIQNVKGEHVIAEGDEIFSFKLEVELIETLTCKQKMGGIVLCVSRPAFYLQKALIHRNVENANLYFVDMVKCICSAFDEKEVALWVKNTVFLGSSFNVDAVMTAIESKLEEFAHSKHFVIVDSIVPLVMYWDKSKRDKFVAFLKRLPKEHNSSVIILMPKISKRSGI